MDELDGDNSLLFGYDEMDRLVSAIAPSAPTTASYTYSSGTNQLASVTDSSGTRTITYDGRGNTASETRPGSITASTTYDGYGRLTQYSRTDLGTADFVYNGLDDRVTMALPTAGTRHFVYDDAGRVMGEYGASASDVQAEFVWMLPAVGAGGSFGGDDGLGGYLPLAVATPDQSGAIQINWIHADHLGTPIVATDSTGALATTPDDYLAAAFPGQSRMFADLYYNRYRDYDPTTGRYIQADPIGLGGGSNPFLYAGANPINAIDPDGKNPILVGIALGAGIELGIQAFDNWRNGRDVFDWECYEWGEVAFAGAMGAFGGQWIKGWVRMSPGSMYFPNVSKRIRRAEKLVGKDVDLHHWLVPQKYIKSPLAQKLFNRPWNLNVVPRPFHQDTLNKVSYWEMLIRGAPQPIRGAAKAAGAGAAVELSDGHLDD